jgi:hypothetical protein
VESLRNVNIERKIEEFTKMGGNNNMYILLSAYWVADMLFQAY